MTHNTYAVDWSVKAKGAAGSAESCRSGDGARLSLAVAARVV
jgi:hypothetical protein